MGARTAVGCSSEQVRDEPPLEGPGGGLVRAEQEAGPDADAEADAQADADADPHPGGEPRQLAVLFVFVEPRGSLAEAVLVIVVRVRVGLVAPVLRFLHETQQAVQAFSVQSGC
jgi:hypothetical protein